MLSFSHLNKQGYEILIVTALLLLAFIFRVVGISFGQPNMVLFPSDQAGNFLPLESAVHPDEYFYVAIPVQMAAQRRLNPDFFENPSLLINLNLFINTLTGKNDKSLNEITGQSQRQIADFSLYIMGRSWSALGGLLAVAATYGAVRLLSGFYAAFLAALIVTVSLPMVQHAHYATTSSMAAGFTALSIWSCVRTLKIKDNYRKAVMNLILAGAAAGLATGSRYNAAPVAFVVVLTGLTIVIQDKRHWTLVSLSLFSIPLAFLISTPGTVFAFRKFISDIHYISSVYLEGVNISQVTPFGLYFEIQYLFVVALGIPVSILVVFSVVLTIWNIRRLHIHIFYVFLIFQLVIYGSLFLRTVRPGHSDQLLVPIIPVLAILAGLGAQKIFLALKVSRELCFVSSIAVVIWPMVFSISFVKSISITDTRTLAQEWIYENLAPQTSLYLVGAYNVSVDPVRFPHFQTYGTGASFPSDDKLCAAGIDFIVFSDALTNDAVRTSAALNEPVPNEIFELRDRLKRYAVVFEQVRPPQLGNDLFMHTATVWHQPGIQIYQLNCIQTSGAGFMRMEI
ncbi:MAG: phospholipid carrier-dependent glycosyltransferase [Pleurocapsa minor GSE-CHR-MK-17-07R]|jgi:4-amino-4-deoxy-L-arabinose transferase-like glycosyltransferase|nr:phospholipid carrier-dependent glycosyltransferase [Pleurocapsa minor GSE-CHR-MK 17-07R]